MSLSRFFNTIKASASNVRWVFHRGPSAEEQLKVLELMETQSDKLYVEHVRAMLDVPRRNAEFLCERAVSAGLLAKKIGLTCPNDQRILAVLDEGSSPPGSVSCEVCESMEREQSTFSSDELSRVVFYQATGR